MGSSDIAPSASPSGPSGRPVTPDASTALRTARDRRAGRVRRRRAGAGVAVRLELDCAHGRLLEIGASPGQPDGPRPAVASGGAVTRLPPMTSAPWSCSSPTPSAAASWARSSAGSRPRATDRRDGAARPSTPPSADRALRRARRARTSTRRCVDFVTVRPAGRAGLEGDGRSRWFRALNGATDGRKAAARAPSAATWRDCSNRENLVHGSDSPSRPPARSRSGSPAGESAERVRRAERVPRLTTAATSTTRSCGGGLVGATWRPTRAFVTCAACTPARSGVGRYA